MPASIASRIFLLKPARLRTPAADISRYLRSISATHQRRALAASFISVTTGASRWGMSAYIDNSSIFGSIMTSLTFSGPVLYNRLSIIAFNATDLPDPVVPATSRCGIFARSATIGRPDMLLPNARVSGELELSYTSERRISDRNTMCRLVLGISRPMVDLPGITSTTRTETILRPRARSLARLVICEDFTPGAGSNSKRVITGPGCTATTSTVMPKSASFNSTCLDKAFSASSL